MKSKKNKQGKKQGTQNTKDYKSLYEAEKSQSITKNLLYKNIQDKNSALNFDYREAEAQLAQIKKTTDETIANLNFHIFVLQDRNKQLVVEKRESEMKYDALKINYNAILSQLNSYKLNKEIELEEIHRRYSIQKKQCQSIVLEYKNSAELFQQMKQQNRKLEQELKEEKEKIKKIQADKQCEKILTVDSIKKQMMAKAYEMRNKAAEIRKSQLDTTTRLTFIQNDQLVRELEYQSLNTEKILKKNRELEQKIKQLKNDIEVHETIEKQVSKRNVYAKKYIQNLLSSQQNSSINHQRTYSNESSNVNKEKQSAKQKQIIIDELTQKVLAQQILIKNYEKNKKMQIIPNSHNKHSEKQTQVNNIKEQEDLDNVAILLARFYNILALKQVDQAEASSYIENIDIEVLKKQSVENWPENVLGSIVKILIILLKPYLSAKSLKLNYFSQHFKNQVVDYQEIKQDNTQVSKYLSALKRIRDKKQKQNYLFKGRSLTLLTSSFGHKPLSQKKSSKSKQYDCKRQCFEPIENRFLKKFNK